MERRRTVCRICEAGCGLVAEVDGTRITALRPDPDHPLSRGYACKKGVTFHEFHHGPTRRCRAMLRRGGALVEVRYEEAVAEVGARLAKIRDASGPNSIGVFQGNAVSLNLGALLGVAGFVDGVGTTRNYATLTLDNSEMYVVAEEVFGNPLRTFVADYDGAELVVLFGTDPLWSQASQAQSNPSAVRSVARAGREGRLVVVDPRRSATAKAASLHVQPLPGTDLWLLTGLLGEVLDRRGDGGAKLEVPRLSRGEVSERIGVPREAVDALFDRVHGSRRPLFWSGLGVLLGPHGTLGWWLTLCLTAMTGGLDTPGGWRMLRPHFDVPRWLRWLGVKARHDIVRTSDGRFPAILGTLPAATLASDIARGDVRALVVVGGNPAVSLPDTARAARALAALELLVVVDVRESGTARYAHALLPATTWLERADLPIHLANQRIGPVHEIPAVVAPAGDARTEFRVLLDLMDASGIVPFGRRPVAAMLRALGPNGLARCALAADRWMPRSPLPVPRLAVPEFQEALVAALSEPPQAGLRLVTSVRPPETMNSWLHEGREKRAACPRLHPEELAVRGWSDGERVCVSSSAGEIAAVVTADPSVRPGVVVLPYGWGEGTGVNANLLVGTDRLEPFTGQPISNGGSVAIRGVPEVRSGDGQAAS